MKNEHNDRIVIVDTGGQYCHLIARRVREAGVQAHIASPSTVMNELADAKGIIISGGPDSVYDPDAPRVPQELFDTGLPVLGICYGHQLLAHTLGGEVRAGEKQEYGEVTLEVTGQDTILNGIGEREQVWMSHGDEVTAVPKGFVPLARSETCPVAAMADVRRKYFGVQFHPEVSDTPCGQTVIANFVFTVCGCAKTWRPSALVTRLKNQIRHEVRDRHVLFFVSGGVDSTVAFALCTEALGPDAVTGVFVDTGLMRKGEREEIQDAFGRRGWKNFHVENASGAFLRALEGVWDPEAKRQIIGNAFLQVQRDLEPTLKLGSGNWLLGQGTIYPDTIESGYSDRAALIKTHHNRVPEIAKLLEQGLVLEPLKEFYKDEVRDIGRQIGLSEELVTKQPFPGPGLAVRCLCSTENKVARTTPSLDALVADAGLKAWTVPLRTVGVQGDHRSYSDLVVLSGPSTLDGYANVARRITREIRGTNRVAFQVAPTDSNALCSAQVVERYITRQRLDRLREADAIAHRMLREEGLWADVWQFPVVLLPLSIEGGETIALRPVSSSDAMTARHAILPLDFIRNVGEQLRQIPGVDMVIYDVTDKPPATIEWE